MGLFTISKIRELWILKIGSPHNIIFQEILKFANLSSSRNSRKLKPREYYQIYSITFTGNELHNLRQGHLSPVKSPHINTDSKQVTPTSQAAHKATMPQILRLLLFLSFLAMFSLMIGYVIDARLGNFPRYVSVEGRLLHQFIL